MYNNISDPTPFVQGTPAYFGEGIVGISGEKLRELGCKNVLVVFDKGIEASGVSKRVVESINSAGIKTTEFNGVLPDPPDYTIDKAVQLAFGENIDGIVSVGGGSSIDTGKAIKLVLSSGIRPVADYLIGGAERKDGTMPLLKIPTTAGTGSEITTGAVITYTNKETGEKKKVTLFGSPTVDNEIAIIDPELMVGCPPKVTAACGMDVLAHALDGSLSTKTNRITQSIGLQSIKLVLGSLKAAYDNGANIRARSDMAVACTLAGAVIANGKVNSCHAFGHSLGAHYQIPHGAAVGIFIPATLELLAESFPEEMFILGDLFGITGVDSVEVARQVGRKIYDLSRSVNNPNIKGIIPNQEDAYLLIKDALSDGAMSYSVIPINEEKAKWIIDRTYEYAESTVAGF